MNHNVWRRKKDSDDVDVEVGENTRLVESGPSPPIEEKVQDTEVEEDSNLKKVMEIALPAKSLWKRGARQTCFGH